jgi:ABC-type molybdate transport system substrate-binding protein
MGGNGVKNVSKTIHYHATFDILTIQVRLAVKIRLYTRSARQFAEFVLSPAAGRILTKAGNLIAEAK